MGSGHILVYLFDVLVQIYEAYGYPTREAVASIVQNNLWGLDIDDRAAQLANFAVMMVARRYDRGWFRRGIQPHVMAIQESNGINRDHLRYLGNSMGDVERNNAISQMEALIDEFIDAKEYGSILQPQEYDWDALRRFVQMTALEQQVTLGEVGIDATQEKLLQIIEQGQALAQKYHVVVTNPPYLAVTGVDKELVSYIKKQFPDSKTDLYAVFIERCSLLVINQGFVSMITQHSWMFLKRYQELRNKVFLTDFINMAHLGTRAFEEIGGEVVQTTSFVKRNGNIQHYLATYCRLVDYEDANLKEAEFINESNYYQCAKEKYYRIPGNVVAYWISSSFYKVYDTAQALEDFAKPRVGLQTSDNDRFVRFWHEVCLRKIGLGLSDRKTAADSNYKWFPYNKGGGFQRWYGNNDYVVNWENDGEEIRQYNAFLNASRASNIGIANTEFYFRENGNWCSISSKFALRYSPAGFISDTGGSALFAEHEMLLYLVGLLNCNLINEFLLIQNPTINFQPGNVAAIPVIYSKVDQAKIVNIVQENIDIVKEDWDSSESSWDFQQHPFIQENRSYAHDGGAFAVAEKAHYYEEGPKVSCPVEACFWLWQQECNERFYQLKRNEEELNRIFIDIYGLQDELIPDVAEKDVTVRKAELGRDVRSLVSYAVGCMLGRYSLKKPGLQFAGGDWQEYVQQLEKEKREEREKNKEFLSIQELPPERYESLFPDKDGILPITDDEYFSDDIVTMFVEWVKIVFGEEMLVENLKYIASALYPNGSGSARELIRQYFLNDFYKDHLKIYQKRPIYWMFDSGKKNGFKCLVYMHRWAMDTVARVRTDYVHEMQSRYRTAIEELDRRVNSANGSERVRLQKQLAKIQGQDAELLKYEEKVHHLADQMIAIDLDDGVKHNYAIFEDVLAPIK